jgi:hypothetical protein
MAQLSIPDIIDLGDISTPLALNYQADGSLFGPRKTYTAATTIALVTDALRWQWEGFPDITEVRATATISIDELGDEGQILTVEINDPIKGYITLGSYTITSADTTLDITAANIANALNSNVYGYYFSYASNVITAEAPEFYGALINGIYLDLSISVIGFLATELDEVIITQNNINLITQ